MLPCGHRTHRVAGLAALLLALALPTVASAAETAYISYGTLYYSNSAAEVDHLTVADGGEAHPGKYLVTEQNTPASLAGTGCTNVTLGQAACTAPVSTINADLNAGADRVTIDLVIAATIYGQAGNDAIVGGGRGDWIWAGLDNDTIHGRGGGDYLSGGDGDDLIEARDGADDDAVSCGNGTDTAYVDLGDSTSGCETVITDATVASPLYTPPPPTVTTPPQEPVVQDDAPTLVDRVTDPASDDVVADGDALADDEVVTDAFDPAVIPTLRGPVRLATSDIKVGAKGVATFELTCAATETAGCRGVFFIDPASGKGKGKGKRGKGKKAKAARVIAVMARRGRFGRSPFVIASGKRRKLAVKLSTAARKALGLPTGRKARAARRGRTVRAKITVVQRGRRAQHTVVTLRG